MDGLGLRMISIGWFGRTLFPKPPYKDDPAATTDAYHPYITWVRVAEHDLAIQVHPIFSQPKWLAYHLFIVSKGWLRAAPILRNAQMLPIVNCIMQHDPIEWLIILLTIVNHIDQPLKLTISHYHYQLYLTHLISSISLRWWHPPWV